MLWSKVPLFSNLAKAVCPTMELFHVYKNCLESIWRDPVFFYALIAPLKHAFFPDSKVKIKPKLKEIEITFTACTLIYPEIRTQLLSLQAQCDGPLHTHVRNLIILFEFFLLIKLGSIGVLMSSTCPLNGSFTWFLDQEIQVFKLR